ncbi:hypothetical protein, partial [Treponema sp.]|uniref:hypothetical protein n=1 Tax=Treponema sp. TaxID=166 RepID=UPI0025CCCF12
FRCRFIPPLRSPLRFGTASPPLLSLTLNLLCIKMNHRGIRPLLLCHFDTIGRIFVSGWQFAKEAD